MDRVDEAEAKQIAEKLLADSKETKVNPEWLINDAKYYLAAKAMMEFYFKAVLFSQIFHVPDIGLYAVSRHLSHAAPALKMNGFDKPDLDYSMWGRRRA